MNRNWSGVFLTRLVIVALAGLVFWMSTPRIVHYQLASSLREATGMEWTFELSDIDWNNRRLTLRNVSIDSASGQRKSIYAETGTINIKEWGLANRSLVISHMKLQGARSAGIGDDLFPSWMFRKFDDVNDPISVSGQRLAKNAALEWLDATRITVPQLPPFESSSDVVAQSALANWRAMFDQQLNKLQQIESQLNAAEAATILAARATTKPTDNPLRGTSEEVSKPISLEHLNELAASARTCTDTLAAFQELEVERMNKSLELDTTNATRPVEPATFRSDNGIASRALASRFAYRSASQLVTWARSLPAKWSPSRRDLNRATIERIDLHGKVVRPAIVIERIEVDGIAIIGGDHFDYILSIDNLTDEPEAVAGKFSFCLRGQGTSPLLLKGVVPTAQVLELDLSITNQPVGVVGLGEESICEVIARGGTASLQTRMTVTDSGCEGQAELFHEFETVELRSLHSLFSGRVDIDRLKAGFSTEKSFATRTAFSATSDDLLTALTSDCGEKLNQYIEENLARPQQASSSGRIDELSRACGIARDEMTRGMDEIQRRVQKIIEKHVTTLAELKTTELPARETRLPKIR